VKVKYNVFKTNATPFGGLYVISEFLNQIKFHKLFTKAFGKIRKVRTYSPSDNIAILMAMIIEGGERLYDIRRFDGDQTVCQLFDVPSIPQDTSLHDDMILLGNCDKSRASLLFQLNEMLFEKFNITSITVDIDGTALPVDGHQEGANKGYCPAELGSRCFQSVQAICAETETVIAEKTMTGECHCSNGIIDFIKPWLDHLTSKHYLIKLRLDTGFFSDTLLKFLESYGNVNYEIGVPQHEWLQNKVRTIKYKSYFHSERQYATFAYGEGLKGNFRYYYVERSKKAKGEQIDLFDRDEYKYRVVVSNRSKQPQVIFGSYNKRAGTEKHIEELKNQYGLGKMVSKKFHVTKSLAWISYLTFTLIGMIRQVAFRRELKKYRLKRLRFILFIAIGYFVRHARETIFKIGLARVGPLRFDAIMQRIWAF
jgi:hypothetical protein